jgi:UDP:flavonoid glycosyltransferase YjiC (YdhE family)
MSRILVYTTPARGHLIPATPIIDELHRRGQTSRCGRWAPRCQ